MKICNWEIFIIFIVNINFVKNIKIIFLKKYGKNDINFHGFYYKIQIEK